ncbi:PREDICTED: uncharacterized protein LOC107603728 isoform X1 [Ficedula albicollis]|uniref:uncharacterized protein LOC107603728 isoform X1 n=1 Tax=Ficedula albicollis TaxID=59894 RepID=UPI0007AD78FD|nr:PREDICTED: uncharacterized protein LOC107603728 isoform X1 [Ficedula albicollis]
MKLLILHSLSQRFSARSPAERRRSVPSPAAERVGDHLKEGLGLSRRSGHRRTPSRACHRAVNFPVGLGVPASLSTPASLRSVSSPDFLPLSALHESALLGARVRSGEERREGDWDNSWSGLFIPVGNTSLYGLQDAVGSLGTKRASNVKAPFEEEIVLLEPHAWTLEGMAQWSDMKALSLQMGTRLCILCLARKAARGHLK